MFYCTIDCEKSNFTHRTGKRMRIGKLTSLLAILATAASSMALAAGVTEISLPDSPEATSWESNTFEEAGWTTFQVSSTDAIDTATLTFDWATDEYPAEGSVWVRSPEGSTVYITGFPSSGTFAVDLPYPRNIAAGGTWKVWLEDDYGDGGHQLTNGVLGFTSTKLNLGSTFVVTTTDDSLAEDGQLSLREAIIAANNDSSVDGSPEGGRVDKIILPSGTISLALAGRDEDAAQTGDLDVTSHIVIVGTPDGKSVIDGGSLDRIFDVSAQGHLELVSTTLTGGNVTPPSTTKIVNGHPAEAGQFPYIAALMRREADGIYDSDSQFCGGTLVSPEWVLTAAHCGVVYNAENLMVALGKLDLDADEPLSQVVGVSEIIIFPKYDANTYDEDIALIHLAEPVNFPTVPMIPQGDPAGLANPGVIATSAGWGALSYGGSYPSHLQTVDLPILSLAEASPAYDSLYYPGILTENMLPAGFLDGTADTCQGDSGGPLLVPSQAMKGVSSPVTLAGIVSWGEECAKPEFAGIYTRLSNYTDWVYDRMAKGTPAKTAGGGAIYSVGLVSLTNCLVYGNAASEAGAILAARGLATINATTITANTATKASAIFAGGTVLVDNSNIWGNSGDSVVVGYGEVLAGSSNIQGWGLEGAITDVDPMFNDAANLDFSLNLDSPLKDTGSWRALPEDIADLDNDGQTTETLPLDLAGGIREQGQQVDPGAFEIATGLLPNRDHDRDGISDEQEAILGTDPYDRDTDGDGFEDGVERALGYSPIDAESPEGAAAVDADNDGVPDANDPDSANADSDGDGWPDSHEIAMGTSPSDANDTPVAGDLNGDKHRDNVDAVRLLEQLSGRSPAAPHDTADADRNDRVDRDDVIALFDWLLGNTASTKMK